MRSWYYLYHDFNDHFHPGKRLWCEALRVYICISSMVLRLVMELCILLWVGGEDLDMYILSVHALFRFCSGGR